MRRDNDECLKIAMECVESGDAAQAGEAGSAIQAAMILEQWFKKAWEAGNAYAFPSDKTPKMENHDEPK